VKHERRIFLDVAKCRTSSDELSLPEDVKHYLFSVLRIREGDEIIVGERKYYSANVPTEQSDSPDDSSSSSSGGATGTAPRVYKTRATTVQTLTIVSEIDAKEPSHAVICVAPALAKGDTNDIIIEKSIELGISHIAIWQSKRSIPLLRNQTDVDRKLQRWRKIAAAAAQQSGRARVPDISFLSSAAHLLRHLCESTNEENHSLLLCSLSQQAVPLRKLSEKLGPLHEPPPCFSVIVGPEGDFSPEEEELFLKGKAFAISLGQRRLKVDTAAITAVAMLDVLFSEPCNVYSKNAGL
jgi:16S rRNA (uracil1498-N3)-methyltransferase